MGERERERERERGREKEDRIERMDRNKREGKRHACACAWDSRDGRDGTCRVGDRRAITGDGDWRSMRARALRSVRAGKPKA